jgi:transaldolase
MSKESGIFYDSANLEGFKKWYDSGIIGGATTNPVILQKEGIVDVNGHIEQMIQICGPDFPISVEVPDSEMSKEQMIQVAGEYATRFPKNAVIKIPMDPRDPQKAFEVIKELQEVGIPTNATLGLTAGQLIGAMEAGAKYVSLFWGRCEEAGGIGAEETLKTVLKYRETHNLESQIIIGSIRNVNQIDKAFSLGADIVTISPKLLQDWMFTQRGVETADEFNKAFRDSQSL